jgi:hypothetical protein
VHISDIKKREKFRRHSMTVGVHRHDQRARVPGVRRGAAPAGRPLSMGHRELDRMLMVVSRSFEDVSQLVGPTLPAFAFSKKDQPGPGKAHASVRSRMRLQ